MAKFSIKKYFRNYLAKKKWYSILSDAVFIIVLVLLINPGTRTDVAAFFIRMTSFSPSALDKSEQYHINDNAKTWQLIDINGNRVSLEKLNNKPIFLNLWATWCPPCVAELPGIIDLYEKYKDKVNFVLVSSENRDKVVGFAKQKDFPIGLFYQNNSLPADFQSQSIPTTFIINKTGLVVLKKKGAARWNSDSMEAVLKSLINN